MAEGVSDPKTYTVKLLLEKLLGKEDSGAPQTRGKQAAPDVAKLRKGDQVSVSQMEQMSVTVIRASATHVSFSAEIDGRRIEFEATWASVDILHIEAVTTQQQDPLVLDLKGDGINLRPLEQGVQFDIDGDGQAERTGFVQGDDALLVWDRGSDGEISGGDLMGNHHGAVNGFEELRRFDGNGDGRISEADAVYSKLRVYQDRNGDGVAQGVELRSLEDAGIAAINLDYEASEATSGGQRITEIGSFERSDGSRGLAADVLFKYQEAAAA